MIRGLKKTGFCVLFLFGTLLGTHLHSWSSSDAEDHTQSKTDPQTKSWHEKIKTEWGGHLKARGSASHFDHESVFAPVGAGTYYDGNMEGRLKNRLFFADWGYFETHYEAVLSGGDTRSKTKDLETLFPVLFKDGLFLSRPIEDDRRFMDLTKTIEEDRDYILYHRLDRLFLALLPSWGTLRIGRQAVTWGNGLLFNPMDLFNPFSPTDIERDYKVGDDMVHAQFSATGIGDIQFLLVPRRNPSTGDVEGRRTSVAGKLHFPYGTTEFDVLMAQHYQDMVAGVGATGYLWNAAWRVDITGTVLDDQGGEDGYLSMVANMDYSWVWWGKNFYGFVEFFYNGLGEEDYQQALTNPALVERIRRGELFTLGRFYLSGHVQVELHPLFNVFFTVINNVEDPSGTLQPHAVWDIAQDFQITFGANVSYGGRDTEFGGFRIPGAPLRNKPANSAYLWLSYYF
jgi:hypothetical protein